MIFIPQIQSFVDCIRLVIESNETPESGDSGAAIYDDGFESASARKQKVKISVVLFSVRTLAYGRLLVSAALPRNVLFEEFPVGFGYHRT